MVGFEVPAGFAHAEGHSHGAAMSIATSPTPWPTTEAKVAKFLQHQSNSWWRGNAHSTSQGAVWAVSFFIYFTRVGWPPTNDCPILHLVTSGLAVHLQLNVHPNGSAADLQLKNAGAASVVGTISDAFITDRWYRVDLLVKIQNKDTPSPGAGGNAMVWVVDKTDDSLVGSTSVVNEDFYGGAATLGSYLQGETGTTPAVSTTVYFGSIILFYGASNPLDAGDRVGDYTIFGVQPTLVTGATPDCDASGSDPGTKDDLDLGTWDNLSDGTLMTRCQYTHGQDQGAVKVPHPEGDARVLADANRYGVSWFGYVNGRPAVSDVDIIFGKETSTGNVVQTVNVPKSAGPFKIIRPAPILMADLNRRQVIGFMNTLAPGSSGATYFQEAWVMSAFEWPPGRDVSIGRRYLGRELKARRVI
ncbi:MAG: hypothetical protein ACYTFA_00195 [Planctomycetota bacterium]